MFDDPAAESKNVSLIQTCTSLLIKYPKETKDYNIQSFIHSAMAIAELWRDDEDWPSEYHLMEKTRQVILPGYFQFLNGGEQEFCDERDVLF